MVPNYKFLRIIFFKISLNLKTKLKKHGFKEQEFYNYSSYISGSGVTESFL